MLFCTIATEVHSVDTRLGHPSVTPHTCKIQIFIAGRRHCLEVPVTRINIVWTYTPADASLSNFVCCLAGSRMEDKVRWHTQDMMRGKLIRASNMASNKQPQEVNSIINNIELNRSIRHHGHVCIRRMAREHEVGRGCASVVLTCHVHFVCLITVLSHLMIISLTWFQTLLLSLSSCLGSYSLILLFTKVCMYVDSRSCCAWFLSFCPFLTLVSSYFASHFNNRPVPRKCRLVFGKSVDLIYLAIFESIVMIVV